MNFIVIGMIIMQAARLACGTCVFESDFGFKLNCNFRKSGLFRVRNLGGVKAHFGLGFSVGDELGFPESLGNLEDSRRRAINYKNLPSGTLGVLPGAAQPAFSQTLRDKHIISRSTVNLSPELRESLARQNQATAAADHNSKYTKQIGRMTEAHPLPLGVPAFRPIPNHLPTIKQPIAAERRNQISMDTGNPKVRHNNVLVDSASSQEILNRTFHTVHQSIVSQPMPVPIFQAMPNSVNTITTALKTIPAPTHLINPNYIQFEEPKFDLKGVTVEELAKAANVTVDTIRHAIYVREQQMRAEHRAMLAAKLRQEFIRTSTSTTTTTTTTTTTPKPIIVLPAQVNLENMVAKVMNAPKEYYPVGYEKNFDDNFKSKVDLPPTSFTCVKQKHFPGLYADTDLGCMVFHVCALTDDGMVRKSFLCPEDTLFDQTILKCNWWFYVDCMSSPSVYDSNIPISKSYQLMKSLSYFSQYAKNTKDVDNDDYNKDDGLNIQLLRETMNTRDEKDENADEEELTSLTSPAVASTSSDEHQHLNES